MESFDMMDYKEITLPSKKYGVKHNIMVKFIPNELKVIPIIREKKFL